MLKIAIINADSPDGLARTVLDGLQQISVDENINFQLSQKFSYYPNLSNRVLLKKDFIDFARQADFIILFWVKGQTDFSLAEEIGMWGKTVFIDGSEVGFNNRYDFSLQNNILNGSFEGLGAVNKEMLEKCVLYFRREKPYHKGILPLPFGIESNYCKKYKPDIKKDIDFFCVFGQDEYPLFRKFATQIVEKFCQDNGFSYHTTKTKNSDEFYELLSRSKVGISIGGGGYDTLRFWEILGNNCLLITEQLDIFPKNDKALDYKRIWQINNLYDLEEQLLSVGNYLRESYNQDNLNDEYIKIINNHSSVSRASFVIQQFQEKRG